MCLPKDSPTRHELLSRIVILSGRKRSKSEKPQPEQVGTEPKDLMPHM